MNHYITKCTTISSHPSIIFEAEESEAEITGIELLRDEISQLSGVNHCFTTRPIKPNKEGNFYFED